MGQRPSSLWFKTQNYEIRNRHAHALFFLENIHFDGKLKNIYVEEQNIWLKFKYYT